MALWYIYKIKLICKHLEDYMQNNNQLDFVKNNNLSDIICFYDSSGNVKGSYK